MRPPPIADVPPAAIADGIAPAKAWLLALIAARELHDAPAIPTAELARDAPTLCAAMLRAVGSDAELDLPPVAARAGAMAGADSPATGVAAVGLLRGALWEALTSTMSLDAPRTAALAERLAWVCDRVAVAAVSAPREAEEASGFRVHDARSRVGTGIEESGPGAAAAAERPARDPPAAERPARDAAALAADRGPAGSLSDRRAAADRFIAERRRFALLAVEVDDADRLLAAEPEAARVALARAQDAVHDQLRPDDVLVGDGAGRMWVMAADLGASGGRSLAERVADAVAGVASPHGAPLSVSIGLVASPSDGTDLAALEARADEALFAARAAGLPIV
jgi:GGDEF domain-containing protein